MKTLMICGGSLMGTAFAQAAIQKLADEGVNVQVLTADELKGQALRDPPMSFRIFTSEWPEPIAVFEAPRFNGYMGRGKRKRF